jgi:hypothetical protein
MTNRDETAIDAEPAGPLQIEREAAVQVRDMCHQLLGDDTADARLARSEAEGQAQRDQNMLAAVRAYADELYSAPLKVDACGVRERLLWILTPPGPTLTFEEAMTGRPGAAGELDAAFPLVVFDDLPDPDPHGRVDYYARALAHPCPVCRVMPGQRCTGVGDLPHSRHAAREQP